jgi:hypothetical protein
MQRVKTTASRNEPPGAYLKKLIEKAGIDKKVTPAYLRHPVAGKRRTIGRYSGIARP